MGISMTDEAMTMVKLDKAIATLSQLDEILPDVKLELSPGIEVGAEVILDSTSSLFWAWPCQIVEICSLARFLANSTRKIITASYSTPIVILQPFEAEGRLAVCQGQLNPYVCRAKRLFLRRGQYVRHVESGIIGRVGEATSETKEGKYAVNFPHLGTVLAEWPGQIQLLAIDL